MLEWNYKILNLKEKIDIKEKKNQKFLKKKKKKTRINMYNF